MLFAFSVVLKERQGPMIVNQFKPDLISNFLFMGEPGFDFFSQIRKINVCILTLFVSLMIFLFKVVYKLIKQIRVFSKIIMLPAYVLCNRKDVLLLLVLSVISVIFTVVGTLYTMYCCKCVWFKQSTALLFSFPVHVILYNMAIITFRLKNKLCLILLDQIIIKASH